MDHRTAQLVRFLDLDAGRQIGLQHRQAFVEQFLHDALRQRRAGLELVDDDALDAQFGRMVGADLLHRLEQPVERAAREVVAVEGDQAALGRDQRRAGVEIQRRRRVHPDLVVAAVLLLQRLERLLQLVDLVAALQLAVQLVEFGRGRHHVEVVPGTGDDEVRGVDLFDAELQRLREKGGGAGMLLVGSVTEQVAGRVALAVEVDHQHPPSAGRGDGRQVACDRGLAHAALLVEHHAPHRSPPLNADIVHCTNRRAQIRRTGPIAIGCFSHCSGPAWACRARTTPMPCTTWPKAAKPWPSGLRRPPKSNSGWSPKQMKNSAVAVPGAPRAIDTVPSRWRRPVCFVVSCAMAGRSGGASSGRFRPHCTTSILCGLCGWLASDTSR
mmetsp:Transcript_23212/g.54894  ORF Transcript_23212/g.54894 Transcript_23212/m.54894 type:complete len:384 (-) Transcript_23212:1573-2724(-)